MISQPEILTELSPAVFPSLGPEKDAIIESAQSSLFALWGNDEFYQGRGEKLFSSRCGLVFETLAKEEYHSLHNTPESLRCLGELIIGSMDRDIGVLTPHKLSLCRPDILVMKHDPSNQIVTITEIGEIKLGLRGTSLDQSERIWQQHDKLIGALRTYLEELHQFRNGQELESLFRLLKFESPPQKIRLLTEEEGLEFFYIIPYNATAPPLMEDWKIYHSNFSQQEIEKITQALLEAAVSKV